MASGRTSEAIGTIRVERRAPKSISDPRRFRIATAKAKSEETATTSRTVATVITRLLTKKWTSGLSRITVTKLSNVTGQVNSAASKTWVGVLSAIENM